MTLVSGAPPVTQKVKLTRDRRVHCTSRVRYHALNANWMFENQA